MWEITEYDVDRVIAALVKRGDHADHPSRVSAGVPRVLRVLGVFDPTGQEEGVDVQMTALEEDHKPG